ncbi:MAG: PAS domain S-box protein [Candidatus Brocadiales bacterium]|nr:PAS domain S-box protein [Candidatus Brocadiales bacterium]
MGKEKLNRTNPTVLREIEEKQHRLITLPIEKLSDEEVRKLAHELQVYQIELGMSIDELRTSQVALQESRDEYCRLYDFAPVGYFTVDKDGLITKANLVFAEMLGVERGLLINTPLSTFIDKECQDKYYLYHRHFEKSKHEVCELKMVKKDGTPLYVQLECAAAHNDDEKPERCLTIATDITERKKTNELNEADAMLQSILSSLYEAYIIVYDRDGNITSLWGTPEMDKRFGTRAVDIVGRSIREIVSPEHVEQMLAGIRSAFDSGEKIIVEYNIIVPGGKFCHEVSLSPMRNSSGNIVAVVGFGKDVTVRKQVEDRLKDSLEQCRVWLDNSPVCTKVVDLDFNLRYMSAAGIKALKIDDVTKLYGKQYPFDFFPEPFKYSMTKNLEKVKETGEIITGEAPVCDIEGNELWFRATIVPVKNDEGRIDFILIVSVDINERKKMEEALIQSEKLTSLSTITAGISHEFNNILAVISGNVQ